MSNCMLHKLPTLLVFFVSTNFVGNPMLHKLPRQLNLQLTAALLWAGSLLDELPVSSCSATRMTVANCLQVRLLMNCNPDAKHMVFQTRDLSAALVALMNLIFAYGASAAAPVSPTTAWHAK
jgi:hypothetical protein